MRGHASSVDALCWFDSECSSGRAACGVTGIFGWDAAVRCVAERLFGEESAEVKTLETLPASRAAYHPKGDGPTKRS
jgi:hypothetical protein